MAQGSVISPKLFNVYLEYTLIQSPTINRMIKEGRVLAFADDLVLMNNHESELKRALEELKALEQTTGIRLNVRKSEILVLKE